MLNVAIDGPAGAGKSTVAKLIAKKLGILYLDTGAMYRALGLKTLRNNLDTHLAEDILPILDSTEIDVLYADGEMKLFLDGEEVSSQIRTNEVSMAASDVSKLFEVRKKLVEIQQRIASERDMVLDGRDICTVVLPSTKHKFFLTAAPVERARRRREELLKKGCDVPLEKLQAEIEARDLQDSTREVSPLRCEKDTTLIDTTNISAEEAANIIIEKIRGIE